jgi:hypothetical protein
MVANAWAVRGAGSAPDVEHRYTPGARASIYPAAGGEEGGEGALGSRSPVIKRAPLWYVRYAQAHWVLTRKRLRKPMRKKLATAS